MSKKMYLSFPIGSRDLEERRAFARSREKYFTETQGCEVVNPLNNGLPEDADWHEHMRQDFRLMMDCDAVFMCRGWQASCGCQLEHNVAIAAGLEIIYETVAWSPEKT